MNTCIWVGLFDILDVGLRFSEGFEVGDIIHTNDHSGFCIN